MGENNENDEKSEKHHLLTPLQILYRRTKQQVREIEICIDELKK